MTVDQRSTSTRTVAATKARTVAKVQRQAIEVLDRIELLPDAVLREMRSTGGRKIGQH